MTIRAALARGFTLIEMAIVVVVIGLVLSGGLLAVAPVLQSSNLSATNAKLDRIEQALVLYVIRNGCLPCPADPTQATGSTSAGQAYGATGYYPVTNVIHCDSGCNAAVTGANQGVVPWVALGLSEDEIKDGYGYRIDYAVSTTPNNLVTTSSMVRTPPSSYPSGSLTVTDTTPTNITTEAAYVLISHGPDHSLAYNSSGTRSLDPHSSTNQTDNGNGTPFVQDVFNGGTSYFDDIVRFRTAPILIQLCGTNACGNPA